MNETEALSKAMQILDELDADARERVMAYLQSRYGKKQAAQPVAPAPQLIPMPYPVPAPMPIPDTHPPIWPTPSPYLPHPDLGPRIWWMGCGGGTFQ